MPKNKNDLLDDFADGQPENSITPAHIRSLIESVRTLAADATGWASYQDSNTSPQVIPRDTPTKLLNDASTVIDREKPSDVGTFYDRVSQTITGREGDGLLITVAFDVTVGRLRKPRIIESWIDIGGSFGRLFRRSNLIDNRNNRTTRVSFTASAYTLDTWEANGGSIMVSGDGDFTVTNVLYLLTRTHAAAKSTGLVPT